MPQGFALAQALAAHFSSHRATVSTLTVDLYKLLLVRRLRQLLDQRKEILFQLFHSYSREHTKIILHDSEKETPEYRQGTAEDVGLVL